MNLHLKRFKIEPGYTVGKLYIDGAFQCHTLEPTARTEKVAGDTAIPTGTYTVFVTHSPRFNRNLPIVMNVPGFEGIRIHAGNRASDTDGCILVGQWDRGMTLRNSGEALAQLIMKIREAEPVELKITQEPSHE